MVRNLIIQVYYNCQAENSHAPPVDVTPAHFFAAVFQDRSNIYSWPRPETES